MNFVYFIFAFPAESFLIHRRALGELEFSQFLRDSYIEEGLDPEKTRKYINMNQKLASKYTIRNTEDTSRKFL